MIQWLECTEKVQDFRILHAFIIIDKIVQVKERLLKTLIDAKLKYQFGGGVQIDAFKLNQFTGLILEQPLPPLSFRSFFLLLLLKSKMIQAVN